MNKWPVLDIPTPEGPLTGIAPLIISASRATDIPAFHMEWFMERLRQGYCEWQNPFHAAQKQYISLRHCQVLVFWSKNPKALLPQIAELEERGLAFYIHYTLNDYEAEGLEPRVPPLGERLDTFRALAERLGKHRVIWRYDPIILGDQLSVEKNLERIQRIGDQVAPYTEKLVFSFVDMYRKTRSALKKHAHGQNAQQLRAPREDEMRALATGLATLTQNWGLNVATCAEAVAFADLGIPPNSCIDPALIRRLCPNDAALAALLGWQKPTQLSLTAQQNKAPTKKDPGQRPLCRCAPSKDIGRYHSCGHGCVYCYAN